MRARTATDPARPERCRSGVGRRSASRAAIAVAVLLAVAAAGQALAKEGVVARLENPRALLAPPGRTISLAWTLRAGKQPFGASGIYARLRGPSGAATIGEAVERGPGRYRARVRIPSG